MSSMVRTVKKTVKIIDDKDEASEIKTINNFKDKQINKNKDVDKIIDHEKNLDNSDNDEYKVNDNKKNLKKNNIDLDIIKINELLEIHINYIKMLQTFMKKYKYKIRFPNFPEEISENIVKEFINKKEKRNCKKTQIGGDLEIIEGKNLKKIEVKCFTSDGPTSFGPTENWDEIYFLDAKNFLSKNFIIYKINLSNNSDTFSNIKINASKNYKDVCKEGKRPRINFKQLKEQLKEHIEEVYNGNLEFN